MDKENSNQNGQSNEPVRQTEWDFKQPKAENTEANSADGINAEQPTLGMNDVPLPPKPSETSGTEPATVGSFDQANPVRINLPPSYQPTEPKTPDEATNTNTEVKETKESKSKRNKIIGAIAAGSALAVIIGLGVANKNNYSKPADPEISSSQTTSAPEPSQSQTTIEPSQEPTTDRPSPNNDNTPDKPSEEAVHDAALGKDLIVPKGSTLWNSAPGEAAIYETTMQDGRSYMISFAIIKSDDPSAKAISSAISRGSNPNATQDSEGCTAIKPLRDNLWRCDQYYSNSVSIYAKTSGGGYNGIGIDLKTDLLGSKSSQEEYINKTKPYIDSIASVVTDNDMN